MSSTNRQVNLLLAEDWQKIYQSLSNADFQSYDFANLRRTMIDYIRTNFPEDFNDYIESSEYLALIDLIAFVGQNIAFRVDLNARENFLETAERRQSLLNLAQLISYIPSRSVSANGLLKFGTVSTTENVIDSNNRNLSGQVVGWNDPSNSNWYDQFIKVLNAAFPQTQQFGNPSDSATIYNIPTAQYRFNASNSNLPVYSFNSIVSGRSMDFEITSTTFNGQDFIYEETPKVGNQIACVYRDDGYGPGSPGTGFFFNFTQGTLNQGTFTIATPSSNEQVTIGSPNINNTDVWLWSLDNSGNETTLWSKVPALVGNNIIYNTLNQNTQTVYSVSTQTDDSIVLNFADGIFGALPSGSFRCYYRVSNNLSYTINPGDINNVAISIPYISASGQNETITITLNLATSVTNATSTESNASIKQNAPQTYYTQNRMITGEDYNISPLAANLQVAKVKAINRTSSGISRYFDLTDPTGKYSSTNLFADDGIIYQQTFASGTTFTYVTQTDIEGVIDNIVLPILEDPNLRNFYYQNFVNYVTSSLNVQWNAVTNDSNSSSGYISGVSTNTKYPVGNYTQTDLLYVTPGALVKFSAPSGYYFSTKRNNILVAGNSVPTNGTTYLWAEVTSVIGDGTTVQSTGFGPITLSKSIPAGAIVSRIIPAFSTTISSGITTELIDLIYSNASFGLRYNASLQSWQIIFENNLNTLSDFSLSNAGDTTNTNKDSSWFLLFTTDTETYTITQRGLRYVFESDSELSFYFDTSVKIYDNVSSQTVTDIIKVLSINTQPDNTNAFTTDYSFRVVSEYFGQDGYIDPKKLVITFDDPLLTGSVDNPQSFIDIVSPTVNPSTKYIVEQKYLISLGQEDYKYVYNDPVEGPVIITTSTSVSLLTPTDGQYYYFTDTETVVVYNSTTSTYDPTLDYKVYVGRDQLKFQYKHSADYDSRIDPGASNIMDIYVLTNAYDTAFRQWVAAGTTGTAPLPPSQDELNNLLSPNLNLIKATSDEIVYHPVNYTLLFGPAASSNLQANFEVIINPNSAVSSANVTARILTAINEFFALENWDFGDTFYFSELSTYVMKQLAPDIISFVIVPSQVGQYFGSLFEITCTSDTLFISCATTDNINVVSGLTSTNLKTVTGAALSTTVASQQITSANYGANS